MRVIGAMPPRIIGTTVIGLDARRRDLRDPAQVCQARVSGDRIHPECAGHREIGEAVSLAGMTP